MEKERKFKKSERIGKLLEEFDKLSLEEQVNEVEMWLKTAIKIVEEND